MSVSLKSPNLEDEDDSSGPNVCPLCLKNPVKYTCPRCNTPYCSVDCYKSEKHADCSESFYKECFMEGLKETTADPGEKEKMLEMLRRAETNPDLNDLDLDTPGDDLEERLQDLDLDEDTDKIWERLTEKERKEFEAMVGDGRLGTLVEVWTPWWEVGAPLVQEVENQSENTTTDGNQSENAATGGNQSENAVTSGDQSENAATSGVSQLKKDKSSVKQSQNSNFKAKLEPCKVVEHSKALKFGNKSKSSNTVNILKKETLSNKSASELDVSSCITKQPAPKPLNIAGKPKLKFDIPNISSLVKTKPSSDIRYNVINMLYSYIFVCRLHNGEHVSMATESAQDLMAISEVMGQEHNCWSTREAIQACLTKIQTSGDFQSTPEFKISIIKDIEKLILQSDDSLPMHFVLLALSDLYEIFKVATKNCSKALKSAKSGSEKDKLKSEKSNLFRCTKKCEFMLSWVQMYGMSLAGLVPDLEIEFSTLSGELAAVNQSKQQLEAEWGGKTRPKKRALVEEI